MYFEQKINRSTTFRVIIVVYFEIHKQQTDCEDKIQKFLMFKAGGACTGVLISPQPYQEGNKLERPNCKFCKPLKKNSGSCPSNQVSAAAMTFASDEKWRPFHFFQSGRAKDLSAPLQLPLDFQSVNLQTPGVNYS